MPNTNISVYLSDEVYRKYSDKNVKLAINRYLRQVIKKVLNDAPEDRALLQQVVEKYEQSKKIK